MVHLNLHHESLKTLSLQNLSMKFYVDYCREPIERVSWEKPWYRMNTLNYGQLQLVANYHATSISVFQYLVVIHAPICILTRLQKLGNV